jgi:accessory gene regulator B
VENDIIHAGALRIAGRLNKYARAEGLELLKMIWGIETLLVNVSKVIIIYSVSALLGILGRTFAVHIAFIAIKRYSFGLHAKNSTVCTAVSVCLFALAPYVLSGARIGNWAVAAVFTAVNLILYRYAPADTESRPITGKKKRALLKKKAVACGIALMAAALLIPDKSIKTLLALGAAYQSILILPLTYKILKRSERNYEEFEQSN